MREDVGYLGLGETLIEIEELPETGGTQLWEEQEVLYSTLSTLLYSTLLYSTLLYSAVL